MMSTPKTVNVNSAWMLFFLFVPFVLPEFLVHNAPSYLYRILQIVQVACLIFLICTSLKIRLKLNPVLICIFLYEFVFFIFTLLNGGALLSFLYNAVTELFLAILACYLVETKTLEPFSRIAKIYFFILMSLNLLSVIVFYPEGMYFTTDRTQNYFLGFDNIHVLTFLLGITLSLVSDYYKNGLRKISVFTLVLICISLFTTLYYWSVTSMCVLLVFLLFVVFRKALSKRSLLNSVVVSILNISAAVLFLVPSFQNAVFGGFAHLFGKSATFSGRTDIWEASIDAICNNYGLGYGFMTSEQAIELVTFSHPHQQYLSTTFYTGFIGLIILLLIVVLITRVTYKSRRNLLVVCFVGLWAAIMLRWNLTSGNLYIQFFEMVLIYGFSASVLGETKPTESTKASSKKGLGRHSYTSSSSLWNS